MLCQLESQQCTMHHNLVERCRQFELTLNDIYIVLGGALLPNQTSGSTPFVFALCQLTSGQFSSIKPNSVKQAVKQACRRSGTALKTRHS